MLMIKKVFRSMWGAKRTYLACVFVIAVGIMCYTALANVYENLIIAQSSFYKQYNFADVFAKVVEMPQSELVKINNLEGIRRAEGRLSLNARVLNDEKQRIITLHLLGVVPDAEDPVNGFSSLGSPLEQSRDILVGKQFMELHGLKEGDEIALSIYGERVVFVVRGAVQSPEYVYSIPDNGSLLPDPYTYDIAIVMQDTLEKVTGRDGVATDIGIILKNGYAFDDVKTQINEVISDFGVEYLIPAKDQASNSMLTSELQQLGGMSTQMSGLFIFVAAVILYIMIRRLVEQERTQIGVLKAFGYSDSRVVGIYMLYGAITGIIGGLLGAILGMGLGKSMFDLYMVYFKMPTFALKMSLEYFAKGVMIALGTGIIAALIGVRGVLKLKPADSMRPSSPPLMKKSFFSENRLSNLLLTKRGMMTLRFIERNKLKSFLIIFSISLSYMLMAIMFSYNSLVDKMMLDQFMKVETYDLKVSLKKPILKSSVVSGINSLDGVRLSEGILELPFSITNKNISKSTTILGLNPGSNIFRIMDEDNKFYDPPADGLIITRFFADKLGAETGDVLTLDSPYLKEKVKINVSRIINTSFGSSCYMDADTLSAIVGSRPIANAVVLKAEEGSSGDIKEELLNGSNVSYIADAEEVLKTYKDMLDSYVGMIYAILIMAVLIAFAVIYNISSVSLSERQRELATMRVLGYSPQETSEILSFENFILFFIAVLVGIPLSIFAMKAMGAAMNSELFSVPSKLPPICFVYAALSCLAAVILSNTAILRSVKKFELVEVLKERE